MSPLRARMDTPHAHTPPSCRHCVALVQSWVHYPYKQVRTARGAPLGTTRAVSLSCKPHASELWHAGNVWLLSCPDVCTWQHLVIRHALHVT